MLTAIDICYRYKTYTFKSTLLNDSAVTPVKLLNQNFKICLYYLKKKKYIQEFERKSYLGGFSIMAHLFHWCRSPPRGQSHSQLDRVWKGSHPSHLHLGLFLVLPHPQMHDIPIDTRGKKIRWRWIIRVYQSTQPLFMGRALYQLSYCGTLNVQNILIQLKKGISLINKKYFKNVFETKLKRCAHLIYRLQRQEAEVLLHALWTLFTWRGNQGWLHHPKLDRAVSHINNILEMYHVVKWTSKHLQEPVQNKTAQLSLFRCS